MIRPTPAPRPYPFERPAPRLVEIHDMHCGCPVCAPYQPVDDRLTGGAIAKLALLGLPVGVAIGFALDPAYAARSLLAIVGIGL